jgi:hypothetical protein
MFNRANIPFSARSEVLLSTRFFVFGGRNCEAIMSTRRSTFPARGVNQATSGFASVEKVLQRTLQPVGPRQSYVASLRSRLDQELLVRRKRLQTFQYVLLSLAGITGIIMLIITSVRTALTILAMLGIIRIYKEGNRQPLKVLSN